MSEINSFQGEKEHLSEQSSLSESTEFLLPKEVQERLELFGLWEKQLWLFNDFIKNNQEVSKWLLEAIRTSDDFDLSEYIMENGFIINDIDKITYSKFMERFGKKEALKRDKKENQKEARELKDIWELRDIFTSDIISKLSADARIVVERILNSKEDIKEDVDSLIENHLDEVLTVLQKIDDEKWLTGKKNSSYEVFKNYILENNDTPEIRAKFENYNRLIPRKPKIYQAQIIAALGSGTFDKNGNTVLGHDVIRSGWKLSTTADQKTIEIDLSKNPPTRSLGLSDSEFQLPTELPLGNFYEALEEEWLSYEEAQKKYQGLKNSQHEALQYVEDQEFDKQDISSIKIVLQKILWKKIYEKLGIESISTKEELKVGLKRKISNLLDEFNEGLEEAEKNMKKHFLNK